MRALLAAVGTVLWLAMAPAPVAAEDGLVGTVLRADPDRLCAATGIVEISRGAIAVVDDAVADLAFGFEEKDGALVAARNRNVDFGTIPDGERPRGVAAAARVIRHVALVGSHARSEAECAPRPEHERMLFLDLDAAGTAKTAFAVDDAPIMQKLRNGDEAACLQDLFTISARPYPATRAFCRALVAAERSAAGGACTAFAIAGAAPLLESQRERLWLGLRAPLVDGKAVLLRLSRIDAFRFDALALVDLGGEGIRALATHGRKLYAIAGSADAGKARALWTLTPGMDPEALFAPTRVRADLPGSSAAMLSTTDALVVVASGTAGTPGGPCKEPARQYRLPVD